MTSAWLFYSIVVGSLISIGARGAQAICRLTGLPVRWTWAIAMVVTLALSGFAPYRARMSSTALRAPIGMSALDNPDGSSRESPSLVGRAVESARRLVVSITAAVAFAQRRLPRWDDSYFIVLWLSVSALLALAMISVHVRLGFLRRSWPTTLLRGVRVRIAPEMGPALIGLIQPDIVVPRWLLLRSAEEQQLVLSHEVEHLRSGDPIVLAAGCAAAVLMPWNPAVWWMLARLRLAVELDCDERVLGRGVQPRRYGELLIDLAEYSSGFRVGVATLADSSHLSQRLNAMKRDIPSFARVRGVAISAVVLSSILLACETSLPTSDQVSRMDASTAERAARQNSLLKATDAASPVFIVDGVVTAANVARALPPAEISSIEVIKSHNGKRPEIRISRKTASSLTKVPGSTAGIAPAADSSSRQKFLGLYLVNGKRADSAAVKNLDPKTILGVEVVKAPAAARLYSDPLAANGVISITTR